MSFLNNVRDNMAKLFKRVEDEELSEKGVTIDRLEDDKRILDVLAGLERSEAFGFFVTEVKRLQQQKKEQYCDCKQSDLSVLQAEDRTLQSVLEIVPKAKKQSQEIKNKIAAMMLQDGIV